MSPAPPPIRCREVGEPDIDTVVNLLTGAFRAHGRSRAFWVHALGCLSQHATPPGFPRYGYMIESDGRAVGVLLLIFSIVREGDEERIRCYGSSFYIEPAFRGYAAMLVSRALRHKNVTYMNISPSPNTLPMIAAQGYVRYSSGRFVAAPALSAGPRGSSVERVTPEAGSSADLSSAEIELLAAHSRYGCISLVCRSAGRAHPFVFAPWRKYGMPFAYLVYCRELTEFVRFAGPVGRFLARHFYPFVVVDANGPLRPLVGLYSEGEPKFFKGPHRPRLGDLAYSERIMFGV